MGNVQTAEPYAYISAMGACGNIGDRDGTKYLESGKAVASRSFACKVAAGKETTWLKAEFWDKKAEVASQYITKGSYFGVSGKLKFNCYMAGENFRIEPIIQVNTLDLMGRSGSNGSNGYSAPSYDSSPVSAPPAYSEEPAF